MNQQQLGTLSGYDLSVEEIQRLVMTWAKVTEAFHYRYARLNKTINSLQTKRRQLSVADRAQLSRLLELRQQSTDVLMTLVMDMSGQRSERSTQSSKPGQLYSHTRLIDELNHKIDTELIGITTVAQA